MKKRIFLDSRRSQSGSKSPTGIMKSFKRIDPVAMEAANSATRRSGTVFKASRQTETGTMIRHACWRMPMAIFPLTAAMGLPASLRALVATISGTPLKLPSLLSTGMAAIALTAITVPAKPKQSSTTGGPTVSNSEMNFGRTGHVCKSGSEMIPRISR